MRTTLSSRQDYKLWSATVLEAWIQHMSWMSKRRSPAKQHHQRCHRSITREPQHGYIKILTVTLVEGTAKRNRKPLKILKISERSGLHRLQQLWQTLNPQQTLKVEQTYFPQGSKDPNNGASGPKYHSNSGIWALKPYYLGPWTLRESVHDVDIREAR